MINQEGLDQNKVNSNLGSIHNCKMPYSYQDSFQDSLNKTCQDSYQDSCSNSSQDSSQDSCSNSSQDSRNNSYQDSY